MSIWTTWAEISLPVTVLSARTLNIMALPPLSIAIHVPPTAAACGVFAMNAGRTTV